VSDNSKIEWTEASWNCITGCTKISAGCDHCYAETFAERWRGVPGHHFEQGFDVRLWPDRLEIPLHWKKPRKVFVNSMSDLFHDDVPDDFIARMFAVMALTARHTFQVLTKRHGRMRSLLNSPEFRTAVAKHATDLISSRFWKCWQLDLGGERLAGDSGFGEGWAVTPVRDGNLWSPPWPLPNVHLGVSAEDQHWANIRVHALLATPAAVRWVSAEPLLGRIDLRNLKMGNGALIDALCGDVKSPRGEIYAACPGSIAWVVVGGESGPGAREMDLYWAPDHNPRLPQHPHCRVHEAGRLRRCAVHGPICRAQGRRLGRVAR
jgi:protein gp37